LREIKIRVIEDVFPKCLLTSRHRHLFLNT
jgi:hypothetical protein